MKVRTKSMCFSQIITTTECYDTQGYKYDMMPGIYTSKQKQE